jgi:hypothetical protein
MVACLREGYLDHQPGAQPELDEALRHCARTLYREQRGQLIHRLKSRGVMVVDAVPQLMHVALVEQYTALKRAGKI